MNEVKNYVKSLLELNNSIVVGCSGGPDSMCLLNLCCDLKSSNNTIICAHINHNIREESASEAMFVKKYCQEHGIIYETMTIENYGNDNFHNEARTVRYNYFDTIIKKYNSSILMTAHHGDDLIETVLMRIVRGSVLKGYSGFSRVVSKDTYKIIRPLITVTKQDIIRYNEENSIPSVNDQSNESDSYTRNRYRHYVLTFLKQEEPNVHTKFLQFSKEISQCATFIDNFVVKKKDELFVDNKLDINKFIELDKIIQTKLIENLISKLYPDDLFIVSHIHVAVILDLIYNDKPNSKVYLPGNIIALKSYNYLEFIDNEQSEPYEYILTDNVTLPNGTLLKIEKETEEKNNYVLRINSQEVIMPLIVRSRKEGDIIKAKNLNGTKKVKDIFIDEKISLKKRDSWPIVTDSKGEILWIPGVKKSNFDKEKTEKYDIIIKYEN